MPCTGADPLQVPRSSHASVDPVLLSLDRQIQARGGDLALALHPFGVKQCLGAIQDLLIPVLSGFYGVVPGASPLLPPRRKVDNRRKRAIIVHNLDRKALTGTSTNLEKSQREGIIGCKSL